MIHTAECLAFQERVNKAHDEYEAQWPNHCRHCNGWGGFAQYNYPREPDDFESCGDCIDKGICPRCGQQAWSDEDLFNNDVLVCPHCGWKDGNLDSGCPEGFDGMCDCGLLDDITDDDFLPDSRWPEDDNGNYD